MFLEFPPVTAEEWEAAARHDLKGKAPGKILYTAADAPPQPPIEPWPEWTGSYEPKPGDVVVDIGPSYFDEIAKLRAMRRLNPKIRLIARTARPAEAGHDALVQATTEAMSAVLGGCDVLIVTPFQDGDPLAERLACNTQRLLREEARFTEVADPAAGSWYIEALTLEWMRRLGA